LLSLVGCGGTPSLNGAGASFPAAIYQRWFQDLAAKGVRVNYQSVGSGAGVRQFLSKTVDFAASDVPLTSSEIASLPRGAVQIPMTAGAIAVAYNLNGCDLKLSQAQLADVFSGKITNFNQLGCAATPIRVIYRSDGSGTMMVGISVQAISSFVFPWIGSPSERSPGLARQRHTK
jgi:phosphate transport system substrate-binding protein